MFAESPNRVFVLQRGELPEIEPPEAGQKIAPSVEFPIGRLPWRDATSASPPERCSSQGPQDDRATISTSASRAWTTSGGASSTSIDAQGNHIEDWTQ